MSIGEMDGKCVAQCNFGIHEVLGKEQHKPLTCEYSTSKMCHVLYTCKFIEYIFNKHCIYHQKCTQVVATVECLRKGDDVK